jgi:hypothetical protein
MPDQGQSENKDLPGFCSAGYGVLDGGMSVFSGRRAGNISYADGQGCYETGSTELNYSGLTIAVKKWFWDLPPQVQSRKGFSFFGQIVLWEPVSHKFPSKYTYHPHGS